MIKILIIFLIGITVSIDLEKQKEDIYFWHNIARNIFKLDLLTRSKDIEEIAQKYSDHLLENPKELSKEHSGNTYKESKLGENIYVGKNQEGIGDLVVDTWMKEIDYYFTDKPDYKLAAHFTQVMWKSTKLFGCGISCNTDKCYVVCNYYPAGNIENKYEENIPIPEIPDTLVNAEEKTTKEEDPLEKFRKEITEKHNEYRKKHNVGELERDSNLEDMVQKKLKYAVETGEDPYITEKYNGEKVGQNKYYLVTLNEKLEVDTIVDSWYYTKYSYNFKEPGCENNKLAQDFVNLIWKNTKKVGCGYICKNKQCYALCAYYPSAGCESIYSQNVLPNTSKN